jgi:hypothetical protein
MLKDVIEVRPMDDYRLWLRFEDGVEGVVDLTTCLEFKGVFAPLAEPQQFAGVQVDPGLGSVSWPCGADLDPTCSIRSSPARRSHRSIPRTPEKRALESVRGL